MTKPVKESDCTPEMILKDYQHIEAELINLKTLRSGLDALNEELEQRPISYQMQTITELTHNSIVKQIIISKKRVDRLISSIERNTSSVLMQFVNSKK